MDPSSTLCSSYSNTFTPPSSYSIDSIPSYNSDIQLTAVSDSQPPQYCNISHYQRLTELKNLFDNPNFSMARDFTNPYETIGRSIFINRAGVKLANIDAVLHVTPAIFTFDQKQSSIDFTFCDIAAGPGGFTQYLQYRYPNSTGYGMTLKSDNLDWNRRILDMKRFTPIYGQDNTGNLYTNWDEFITFVLSQQPDGVDLVTADGGFEIEQDGDRTLLNQQEWLSSRLLLVQALIGMNCTKIGGNFVLKCFDTVTAISAQTIYLLSLVFEHVVMFKPVTSRPANSERYIVCLNKIQLDPTVDDIMRSAANAYTDNEYVSNLVDTLPADFIEWLTTQNNLSIKLQSTMAGYIIQYMRGVDFTMPKYNIPKFLTIWNLPDTPPFKAKGKFKKLLPGQTVFDI